MGGIQPLLWGSPPCLIKNPPSIKALFSRGGPDGGSVFKTRVLFVGFSGISKKSAGINFGGYRIEGNCYMKEGVFFLRTIP